MMADRLAKSSLTVLLIYTALVVAWQVTGVVLIANGHRAPGPSASLAVAGISLALAAGFVLSWHYFRPAFYALCALLCWGAGSTIVNAFTADPGLWPSDWARYTGVAINLVGVAGTLMGLAALIFVVVRRFES